MPILGIKDNKFTRNLTTTQRRLGVDLRLDGNRDLQFTNLNDFALALGAENAAQAVNIKLFLEKGGLILHPEVGTNLAIGNKTTDAFTIRTQILRSLSQDSRFENVDAQVTVDGNTYFVAIQVQLLGTGNLIPFEFAIPRQ